MTKWLAIVAVGLVWTGTLLAQQGSVAGKVEDEAGQALVGANVAVKGKAMPGGRGVSTDREGKYRISDLAPGTYEVTVSYVGHKGVTQQLEVKAGEQVRLDFALKATLILLEQSVVSASRSQEKVLDAPASVAVVEAPEIRDRPVLSVSEHIKGVPGVDFARTGLVQSSAVVRGFNNVFSGALMVLADNRLAHVPSLRLNAYNFIPVVDDDIERIEVVLGPGSALYGPNSANGVMHIITRSPLSSQGTSVRLGGGEHSLRQVELRHAGLVNAKLGYKISAQYYQGKDWKYYDPEESEPASQDTVRGYRITRVDKNGHPLYSMRDFDLQRESIEARLDYRPGGNFSAIAAFGYNRGDYIEMTGLGAAQADGWASNYAQLRLLYRKWFAQVFRNWSSAGDTYLLRTAHNITDRSSLTAFQLQHSAGLGARQRFIYGADVLLTRPNTNKTITGQNEEDDDIDELGGYLQSETVLHRKLDLVLALRYDDHNRIKKAEWSPRAALVFKPRETQTLRLTYNRAFGTPTSNNLYLDLSSRDDLFSVRERFGPIFAAQGLEFKPIDLRVQGTYRKGFDQGFSFPQSPDGRLLFRSPFTPLIAGQLSKLGLKPGDPGYSIGANGYLALNDPVAANVMWGIGRQAVLAQLEGSATQLLMATGADAATAQTKAREVAAGLRSILPEKLDGLRNTLRQFNLEEAQADSASPFDPVTGVADVSRTKPTITKTYELGYKGILGGKLVMAADAYRTTTENFVGPLQVITPNVFLDPVSLGAALGPALAALRDPANAALVQALGGLDNQALGGNGNSSPLDELTTQIVGGVARIPFGTVSPEQAYDPTAIILTYRNYGEVTVNGLDLSLAYYPTDAWSITGNYSFVNDNFFANLDSIANVTLNAPKHKVKIGGSYQLPRWNLRAGAQLRYNGSYPMESGVYVGKVKAYTLLDLNLVYRLPVQRDLSLILNADNVLDKKHREFVGAPEIGRLVFAQLGVNF